MRSYRATDQKIVREIPDIQAQASPGVRWEYKSILLPRAWNLNPFGAEGWELVSVIAQPGDQAVFYFRRKK